MKALVIEDESLVARQLIEKIKVVAPDVQILEVIPSIKVAMKWFMNHAEPDFIFMDIQLSDGVSFEIFDSFKLQCPIIFTTAYDDFAIKAFKVNGVDYLLKPIIEEDLKRAITKCRKILESKELYPSGLQEFLEKLYVPASRKGTYKEKFIVSHRQKWIPVNTTEIACFIKENLHYIHTFNGEKFILDFTSLEEIEELLDPNLFYRANRQSIIHIEAIKSIKLHENQKLTLTLRPPLNFEADISRDRAPIFKKWFDR